ncbi:hypothetical protein CENSYa_1287 [Cenarchaeum symbiosum A]|uniref:Uncharacterized protein n=1 Tax=Cenarchaeum symbiosum (strain A) TaxID=414004 RepID=A0RX43_CENSY|nr:hypothetical protein CENSYa_1287 [Cenarchaeum symbiosum A]
MAELISYAFMDEGTKSGPAFDSYHYMLSDDGRKFAKDAMKDYNSEYSAICRIVRACEERDSVQPGQLADAAKMDYIMRSAKSVEKSDDEIIKDASKLGWRMTKDDVAAGRVLLGEIIQASRNEMRQ